MPVRPSSSEVPIPRIVGGGKPYGFLTRRQLSGVKLQLMSTVFAKLNFKEHKQIVVLDSPDSFESELAALKGVEIIRDLKKSERGNVLLGVRDYSGAD